MKKAIGSIITEAGSSKKNITSGWRTSKPIIDKKRCIGCGNCEKFCPDGCVHVINKKAEVEYDYCKGCGICAVECPVKCIKMEKVKK